jgi:hypothetical protein
MCSLTVRTRTGVAILCAPFLTLLMQLSGWQAYFLGSIRVNGLGLIDLAQTVDSHARNLKLGGLSGYLSLSLSLSHTHTHILEVGITSQKGIKLYVVLIKWY